MDSFNNNEYEKEYISHRKPAKAEARVWLKNRQKGKITPNQYRYLYHNVGKDYEQTLEFLQSWIPEAWAYRHTDEQLRDDIRQALQLTIHLKHLYNNLK